MRLHCDGRGFEALPWDGAWHWGLELTSYGFEGDERIVSDAADTSVVGNRLTYWRDADLQEWFVNERRGFEHGFTLLARPPGEIGALRFTMALRGGLTPEVAVDGRAVNFLDADGVRVIDYTGLVVCDADGRRLPAEFETTAEGIVISVDDRGARYPIVVDPWVQDGLIKAAHADPDDVFGSAVAISEDTVVIGAWDEDSNATGVNGAPFDDSAGSSGAAYVFVRSGTVWVEQAYLKPSNTDPSDRFGFSVAISGGTIVVGAWGEDSAAAGVNGNQASNAATTSGAAYVFVRSGTTWSQQAYLKASNPGVDDVFGRSVAVAGDTIVVGAPLEDSSSTGVNGVQANNGALDAGAAYVFVRSGTVWSQQAYLKASNTGSADEFGVSVSISGDTIVVGARDEDSAAAGVDGFQWNDFAADAGAAYVFVRSGTTWSQQAYLKASNTDAADLFGNTVAVSGDTVVVGARFEDSSATGVGGTQSDNGSNNSGAAYVFERSGSVWTQQAYLKASNTGADDGFGNAVAIFGDKIVVAANGEDSGTQVLDGDEGDNGAVNAGAAYVFVRSGATWSQAVYLKASNADIGDLFGTAVAIWGDTIVVGAPNEDSPPFGSECANSAAYSDAGAVFTFTTAVEPEPTTAQVSQIKASNVGTGDQFGYSVGISGDTIVVGAFGEDSSATGVDGDQLDNLQPDSGGAYVFVRSGADWSQEAYLKPSNTGANDRFGHSVSIAGDTIVVGSPFESSGATGVNGIELDDSATSSGAVYVFVRSGTVWTQQAYLKASNTGVGDGFGYSVSISGDTIVVGSPFERSSATGIDGDGSDNAALQSGAAYVFVRSGTVWTQQAYVKASNTGDFDSFGYSVAISGDTIVVGAFQESSSATGVDGDQLDNVSDRAGAAYVFVRSGTAWSQQAYLKASNTDLGDEFGTAVAISNDRIVVGALGEDSNALGVDGDQADNSANDSGAAYVFARSGGVWTQQAYLKASNTHAGDWFGFAVSSAGGMVVVGATREDSSSSGVDGDQLDRSAGGAGAAYVFTHAGTVWAQQTYLKALNTGAGDRFAWSIAISGDTVVSGAKYEEGSAAAASPTSWTDNCAPDSGSAYAYRLFDSSWTAVPLCPPGHHAFGGPQISLSNVPFSNDVEITATNMAGTPICGLLIGFPLVPLSLDIIGSTVPGASLCVDALAVLPCNAPATSASFVLHVDADLSLLGRTFDLQWIEWAGTGIDFGTSQAMRLDVGS
ncbi:MAG: FG-GAP repeat protein [Planctomycetes bacterium]|nr:FG-GAP repeat protein [Planctomycetota bacterium]